MQREIKFRAWDNKRKVWLDTVEVFHDGSWMGSSGDSMCTISGYSEPECVLMQYTGLKDKNGKEIYEGDIVLEVHRGESYVGRVIWENGGATGWGLSIPHGPRQVSFFWLNSVAAKNKKYKVIGNIYENPELIKEEKEA